MDSDEPSLYLGPASIRAPTSMRARLLYGLMRYVCGVCSFPCVCPCLCSVHTKPFACEQGWEHSCVCCVYICVGWSKLAIPHTCVRPPSRTPHGGYMQWASDKVGGTTPSVPTAQVAMSYRTYCLHQCIRYTAVLPAKWQCVDMCKCVNALHVYVPISLCICVLADSLHVQGCDWMPHGHVLKAEP